MMRLVTAYMSTGAVLLGIDAIWLSIVGDYLYRPLLGDLLAPQFRLGPAALFYLLYVAGVVLFVVLPTLESGRLATSFVYGAAFGLVAYGTYDLTNQATLRNWPPLLTVVDLLWGSALTAVAATAGVAITRLVIQRWASG